MSGPARRLALLLLVAVFGIGVATGWVLDDVADELDWPVRREHGGELPPGSDTVFDDDEEEEFLESLGLSDSQLEEVDRLLDAGEDRLEQYWRGRLPEIEAVLDSTRAGIRRLLTPAQRAAYDRWLAAHHDRTTPP